MARSSGDGPVDIPAFWARGVRYVFLKGPGGERFEFNQRLDLDPARRTGNLDGWSHLGIPVTNIERSRDFYRQFGFIEAMYAEIPAGAEAIKVSMMERQGFVLEFYQLVGDDLAEVATRQDGHIDHIALDVLDAEQAHRELRCAGLEVLEEAPVMLPFWEKGSRYFNVQGPDGEKIEFSEIIK